MDNSFTEKRRKSLHPELIVKVLKILDAMETLGFPMMVTDGARTAEEQHKLYQQGRDKPGKVVTFADGYRDKSNHQLQNDTFGHAVDCTFVTSDGKPTWSNKYPWHAYGECAKALKLRWGGDNPNFKDMPHIELP